MTDCANEEHKRHTYNNYYFKNPMSDRLHNKISNFYTEFIF